MGLFSKKHESPVEKKPEPVLGEISKAIWELGPGNRITKIQADILAASLQRQAILRGMHQYSDEINRILREEYPATIDDPSEIFDKGIQDLEEGFFYQVEDPEISYVGPFDALTELENFMVRDTFKDFYDVLSEA